MTRIDMENNIIEFEHKKALDDAFLLLSYIHQMPQFKKESPSEFMNKWAESYQDFLEEKKPFKRFEREFKKIRQENKKEQKEMLKALDRGDIKKFMELKKIKIS
ncbi:hypothetical protein [Helicobacter cappadocius]|uniref:Uncharacterized protein n=1 Tax=Helicobacter cappadocius TaxID=3063998 RepID=A0AA90Q0E6_9HELI|nr:MULTISPECIES: hypothetical protein [unclassified Helicobacter]MDO7253925.1 hypothetical protein [Helicobacter sp. faydin-H75]MDP2539778.1 hypothetical protein [Helicobacter sp. faydin-H76]